jgi:glycosyltransferase involved in cell wall biosynthesis
MGDATARDPGLAAGRARPPDRGGDPARPSVCLFTGSRAPSGVGEHMLALAAGLRDRCRVALACPPGPATGPLLERAAALGVEAAAPELGEGRGAAARLAAWLRGRAVDVFHVHAGIGWEDLAAAAAGRAGGARVVLRTEHLPYLLTAPWQRAAHARMLRHLDRLVCVSEASRASHLAAGVPPALLAVVRNGIEPRPPRRGRAATRAALGLRAGDRVVLTVARLTGQKDPRTLLRAAPAVLAREPRARFLWAGVGPLGPVMRAAVRRRGLGRQVRLLGHRDDVPDLLAAADLFALPSRFEGLPLALLEAMAAGLPAVATRVSGVAEVVEPGRTGLLVEPGAPAALAGALARLLGRPDEAARLGAAARARAGREFGAGRMVGETWDLYRELLARAAPGPGAP